MANLAPLGKIRDVLQLNVVGGVSVFGHNLGQECLGLRIFGGRLGFNDRAKGSVRGTKVLMNLPNERVFGGVVANPS